MARNNRRKKIGLIFVICGPSGSGKTTLRDRLLRSRELRKKFVKSISLTTRSKRSGERQGREYFFITHEEFRRKLKAGKILEWTRYLGYYYATPCEFFKSQIQKGENLLLCLDLKGTLALKRIYPKQAVTIFILPPSLEALRSRIEGRCSKTKKGEINQRLRLARRELLLSSRHDYSVVNINLAQAVKELKGIILGEIKRASAGP